MGTKNSSTSNPPQPPQPLDPPQSPQLLQPHFVIMTELSSAGKLCRQASTVSSLQATLSGSTFQFIDFYAALLKIIQNPFSSGSINVANGCCGTGLEPNNIDEEEDYVPAISIVGRPNVGKSSILNALVGEDRTIVSPVSDTTRDAIDTEFTRLDGQKFQLIDTAGIRKRAAVFILIIDAASEVEKERSRRLGTSILNQVVLKAVAFKPRPRTRAGERGRVYYCTQAAIRPPTFVFFVNDAKLFPQAYCRYMERQLRADAGFSGTPIRLLWRSRRVGKDEGKAQESK
ncbi:GTPase Der [Arachis hypogaea]|uniref:GTPase Der n=1 Tax=Arachis hypogaea TaxID=3818 RepID=A0A6B9VEW0_ARAHY|nr:GTPase Der [Arachis hypogaea]